MEDTFVPVNYPFRNSRGKWQVDDLELDSQEDKLYISSLLEFKELVEGNEGINKGSNE